MSERPAEVNGSPVLTLSGLLVLMQGCETIAELRDAIMAAAVEHSLLTKGELESPPLQLSGGWRTVDIGRVAQLDLAPLTDGESTHFTDVDLTAAGILRPARGPIVDDDT